MADVAAHTAPGGRARPARAAVRGGRAAARAAALAMAAALLPAGVASAFVTRASETASRAFAFGDVRVSIEGVAGGGPSERALSDLLPDETREFAPVITVAATSQPAYLFAKVKLPCAGDGRGAVDILETDMALGGGSPHWKKVEAPGSADVVAGGVHAVVYAWVNADGSMRAVAANGAAAVCAHVSYAHEAPGALLAGGASVGVDAYAVQAQFLGADHARDRASTPEEVWGLVTDPSRGPLA